MAGVEIVTGTRITDGTLLPRMWSAQAADVFPFDKQQHLYNTLFRFHLKVSEAPVAATWFLWSPEHSGELIAFHSLLNDTGTSTNLTFDLKKNGTSVLTSAINMTHSDADRTWKAGTLNASPVTFAADDLFEVVVAITSSTGALGPAVRLQALRTGG